MGHLGKKEGYQKIVCYLHSWDLIKLERCFNSNNNNNNNNKDL